MTVRKLIKKYQELFNKNYETICIMEVINDLHQCLPLPKNKREVKDD